MSSMSTPLKNNFRPLMYLEKNCILANGYLSQRNGCFVSLIRDVKVVLVLMLVLLKTVYDVRLRQCPEVMKLMLCLRLRSWPWSQWSWWRSPRHFWSQESGLRWSLCWGSIASVAFVVQAVPALPVVLVFYVSGLVSAVSAFRVTSAIATSSVGASRSFSSSREFVCFVLFFSIIFFYFQISLHQIQYTTTF